MIPSLADDCNCILYFCGHGSANQCTILWQSYSKCIKEGTQHSYFQMAQKYYYAGVASSPFMLMNLPLNVQAKQLIAFLLAGISKVLFIYSVSESNGTLLSETDAAGRVTGYTYSQQTLETQMSRKETSDEAVTITFMNLAAVNHPTGARTEYTYSPCYDVYPTPYEGKHGIFVLTGRKDLPSPSNPANVVNARAYSYEVSGAEKKEVDDDGAPLYGIQDWGAPYTSKATVLLHPDASGAYEIKEVTTFHEDGFKDDEIIYHIVDGVEKRVEQHEYVFDDRLLTVQLDSYLNYDYTGLEDNTNIWQRITQYQYTSDKKGNPTQIVELYPACLPCKREKNFVYDANFSIPIEQSVLVDNDSLTYTVIRDTLRAETDGKGKIPAFRRIFQKVNGVETLQEKTQYTYDAKFRPTSEKRFFGNALESSTQFIETVYTYDDYTDEPASSQISGVKDIKGVLVASPNGAGVVRNSIVHDWFGRVISRTDPNGNKTTFAYDGIGRETLVTHPDATTKATVYNNAANTVTITDENGVARKYEYTPLGKIAKESILSPDTVLTSFQYDHLERLVSQVQHNAAGQAMLTTAYTYNRFDQVLTKQTTGSGVDMLETHTYNPAYPGATHLEQIVTAGDSDAPSMTKYILRDPLEQVVTEQLGNLVTQYTYDNAGNQLTRLDPRGYYTSWEYDYAGRVVCEINAVGQKLRTTFDAIGRKVKTRDRAGNDSLFTYDAAGRMIQQETPFNEEANAITRFFYDAAGNLTKQAVLNAKPWYEMGYDDKWRETQYTYDSRNRLVDTILYSDDLDEDIRTRFVYDGVGNKISQYTGMLGNGIVGAALTAYTYNRFGKVLTMTDPLKQVERYLYDNIGRLTSKIDRNGNTTAYTYDAAGRLLTESVTVGAATSTITHTYTKTGQKKNVQNGTLTISYQYDAMGRMIQETQSDGVIKAYQYDENGNRTQFFVVRGSVEEMNQSYLYDQLNRLVEMGNDNVTIVKYSYDANGNRTMMAYPQTGACTGYQYNAANLVEYMESYVNSELVEEFAYNYYLDGNIESVQGDNGTLSHRYDAMGRIIEDEDSSDAGYDIEYTYDRFGNRATMLVMNADYDDEYDIIYTYDLNNRLVKEVMHDVRPSTPVTVTTTYTYDKNGNQLTKVSVDGTETRSYNGFGQLVGISGLGGPASYTYRPDGLRHSKTTGSGSNAVTHKHVWDGQNIVAEIGTSGTINTRYIRGLNLIARKVDSNLQYYWFNMHGDVLHLLDANGNRLIHYQYDAFGNQRNAIASDTNPFRYCGEYFDKETKTYYLRARNYNPFTGRFTSEDETWSRKTNIFDPDGYYQDAALVGGVFRDEEKNQYIVEDPLGLNLYTYCHNNPVRYTDVLGKFVSTIIGGVMGGISGALTGGWSGFWGGLTSGADSLPVR